MAVLQLVTSESSRWIKLHRFLDVLRFSAAILVLLSHSATFLDIYLPVLSDFGSEAVAVFFVLSGYVISYVVAKKEDNPASYFKARAFRIYSVLIPALIITFIFDHIGLSIDSSYYFAHKNFHNDYSFVTITQTLTFLGETLNRHIVFGTNEPIWSIQFECLYYIAFGAILFARKNHYWFYPYLFLFYLQLQKSSSISRYGFLVS
jgi:peptidoglycan/LPS O-acetylase OafA/YrhL